MDSDGFWLLLVVAGVGLVLGGLANSILSTLSEIRERQRSKIELGEDSADFRKLLRRWESVVLAKHGTVRMVKRFANRARFVTTVHGDGEDETREAFVGFIALEECGQLDAMAREFDFEKWRTMHFTDQSLPKNWAANVRLEQWEAYKEVVTGGAGSEGAPQA